MSITETLMKARTTMRMTGCLLLVTLVGACESSSGGAPGLDSLAASAPSGQAPAGATKEIDAQFQGLGAAEPVNKESYKIGPSDVLGIAVFQVPELNVESQVASNGTITLPLIGIIKVGGKQAQEVGNEIAGKLRAKYMQSPQVSVFVKSYNSQKVVVSGAVTQPGTIPMTGDTTLMSAIADAKGFSELADSKTVMVFRRAGGHKYAARFNVDDIQSGKSTDPHLMKGDVVVVDTSDTKSWLKTLLPIVATAGIFVALI